MKAMGYAFAAAALIALVAHFGLDYAGFSTRDVASGPAVRLD